MDRFNVLEKVLDCYFDIVLRLLNRAKLPQAKEVVLNIWATIEKIDSNDPQLSHGLIIKYELTNLKLIKSQIDNIPAGRKETDPSADKLYQTGFAQASDTFRFIMRRKDQVKFFFPSLECLIYSAYFAIKVGNVSQAYQFGTVIKSMIETFMKRIEDQDKNNLLVEVMIFCKKYQATKGQRYELYHLMIVALIFYSGTLIQTDQAAKAKFYLLKVRILCKTVDPDNRILSIVEAMLLGKHQSTPQDQIRGH